MLRSLRYRSAIVFLVEEHLVYPEAVDALNVQNHTKLLLRFLSSCTSVRLRYFELNVILHTYVVFLQRN